MINFDTVAAFNLIGMAENPFVTCWAGTLDTTNLEYLTCIVFLIRMMISNSEAFDFLERLKHCISVFTTVTYISVFVVQENIIVPFSK